MLTQELDTHENIVREAARISSVLYAYLLANMSIDKLDEMFREVDAIVYRLQNMPSMNVDPRIKPTTYNALSDKRSTTYSKYFSNAMALPITDPVELKAFQVAIYKANGEFVDGADADMAARESVKKAKGSITL